MRFKAVCTDIDGTLLNADRQISEKTRSIFRELPESVHVILASSRMPAAMRHLQSELDIVEHPMICYNGGYVVRYAHGPEPEVIHNEEIPLSVVGAILSAVRPEIHASLYYRDEWYAPGWDFWSERESRITKVTPLIGDPHAVVEKWNNDAHGAHKVMCMGPEDSIHQLERYLNEELGSHIHVYRSRPTYLELAPVAISKGKALEIVCGSSGIGLEDVISFGDNYNDVDLLKMSGHGVAVGNAIEEVKAVANEITADSKEDGVAILLERHLISTFR